MGRGKSENERRGCVALESCRWACRTLVGLVRDVKVGLANLHVITEGGVGGLIGIVYGMIYNSVWVGLDGVKRRRGEKRER
jgi:hypothetical protein